MAKSNMVKSPAGEQIQITTDEDWVEAVGASTTSLRQWQGAKGMKPLVLRALWEHGEFTSPNGRTAIAIMQWLQEHFPGRELAGQNTIMSMWTNPVNYPAVISKTQGKRTYSLKLVAMPETWHRKLMQDIATYPISRNGDGHQEAPETAPSAPVTVQEPSQGDREAAATMEAILLPPGMLAEARASTALDGDTQGFTDEEWAALQLDAPTIYEQPPPLEVHIANQVALSLLTTVVEIISAGSADTTQLAGAKNMARELEQSQHLLSQRLMENDKLRRQLREAGDAITALRVERDGLRSRLRMTEHNLTEVLKGETAQAVNSEIAKRVDQFMRQSPTPKGDD